MVPPLLPHVGEEYRSVAAAELDLSGSVERFRGVHESAREEAEVEDGEVLVLGDALVEHVVDCAQDVPHALGDGLWGTGLLNLDGCSANLHFDEGAF